MKQNKYKILVLADLKKSTQSLLNSTISLAKMVGGTIDFFYVKKPTDILKAENQLSAMRTLNREFVVTDKKIKDLLMPYADSHGMKIQSAFSFGNVKSEVKDYIARTKPDIIVLGKRKSNALKFGGDNITEAVLKMHNGPILIAAEENGLEPNKELSMGMLEGFETSFSMDYVENIMGHAKRPLKSFKTIKKTSEITKESTQNNSSIVEYVFEKSDDTVSKLDNYMRKSNINLLCLNRASGQKTKVSNFTMREFKDVVGRLNVSMLISNGQELALNG